MFGKNPKKTEKKETYLREKKEGKRKKRRKKIENHSPITLNTQYPLHPSASSTGTSTLAPSTRATTIFSHPSDSHVIVLLLSPFRSSPCLSPSDASDPSAAALPLLSPIIVFSNRVDRSLFPTPLASSIGYISVHSQSLQYDLRQGQLHLLIFGQCLVGLPRPSTSVIRKIFTSSPSSYQLESPNKDPWIS